LIISALAGGLALGLIFLVLEMMLALRTARLIDEKSNEFTGKAGWCIFFGANRRLGAILHPWFDLCSASF
jgi:hypothetical protein